MTSNRPIVVAKKSPREEAYATLELSMRASEKEIKQAYRRLALLYHPDRVGNNSEANERMSLINDAYAMLT